MRVTVALRCFAYARTINCQLQPVDTADYGPPFADYYDRLIDRAIEKGIYYRPK